MSSPDSNSASSGSTVFPDYLSDYNVADKEYNGFIKLVLQSPQPLKKQLTDFLYPFYVYIYLIFLKEDKVSDACKFVTAYSKPFLLADGFREAIENLLKFKSFLDAWNDTYFKQFCKSKYIVKVSEDGFNCLTSYLEETDSKILKFILQLHLEVTVVKDDQPVTNTDVSVKKAKIKKSITAEIYKTSNKSITEEDENICFAKTQSYLYTIHCDSVCTVDITFKYKLLACGLEDSFVHVWNLPAENKDGETGERYSTDNNDSVITSLGESKILKGHKEAVYGLAFCSAHNLLLSCSEDKTVRAWSLEKFTTATVYYDEDYPILDVTVNSNNSYFATASMDLSAHLWSFERSKPLRAFAGHSSVVDTVKFHPNSRYLATASSDRTLQLWTVEDGRSVRNFLGHESYISSIAFSPNGQQLASSDKNGCIKIWDLGSGKPMCEIKAHTSRILSLAYNKGGSMIASGGFDKTLKVWDVQARTTGTQASSSKRTDCFTSQLYDSHFTNSILHLVSFRKKGSLVSIAASAST